MNRHAAMKTTLPYIDVNDAGILKRMPITGKQLTVGRHADNQVVLRDERASRFHAVIERTASGLTLRDLESRNGTRLNNEPVQQSALNDGDEIRIGMAVMKVAIPDQSATGVSAGAKPPAVLSGQSDEPLVIVEDAELEEIEDLEPMADPLKQLQRTVDSLPDRGIDEMHVGLLNARNAMVHPPRLPPARPPGRPPEAVDLLRAILLVCFRSRASDIHIEPKNDDYQVRTRVDGSMVEVVRLPKELGVKLTAVVKILCELDIATRNIVQEGHFAVKLPDRRVDYRVSYAPAMYGQKAVIRVLDTAGAPQYLWDLEMPRSIFQTVQAAVQKEAGSILVCGPTGSGKTTTLYAVVRSMDSGERNIVTIEDPVEIQIDGVTQIPVNEEQGSTFPNLLKSVLRQDPDAILVGEIRDSETARTAMQAAMTGHLVFSTVHSRDSAGAWFRLFDLGVEPYLVASGLQVILAQWLVRKLCQACKKPVKPTAAQAQKLGNTSADTIYEPAGCPRCLTTGYAGRICVFELLTMNDALREVILNNVGPQQIKQALAGGDFVSLMQNGYQLVCNGVTSFAEVDRAVGQ